MADIGDRVQLLSNHWCRPNHKGTVMPLPEDWAVPESTKAGRVLVQFDHKGVGIDGQYLFVDEQDFKILGVPAMSKSRLDELLSGGSQKCRIPKE